MKKIISLLIGLFMLFTFVGNKSFTNVKADETSSITITSTQTQINPGDEYNFKVVFHSKYNDKHWQGIKTMLYSDAFGDLTLKSWSTDISVAYTDLMGKGTKEYFVSNENRYSIDILVDGSYPTSNDITIDLTFVLDASSTLEKIDIIPVISKQIKLMIYTESDVSSQSIVDGLSYSISTKSPLSVSVNQPLAPEPEDKQSSSTSISSSEEKVTSSITTNPVSSSTSEEVNSSIDNKGTNKTNAAPIVVSSILIIVFIAAGIVFYLRAKGKI